MQVPERNSKKKVKDLKLWEENENFIGKTYKYFLCQLPQQRE